MGSTMTNRYITYRRWYRGLALWLLLANHGHAQTPSKDLCSTARDLVFIVDQSGTMARNDPEGLRWGLVKYALQLTGRVLPYSDRVVVIPFGSKTETDAYVRLNYPSNKNPQWYDLAQPYSKEWLLKNIPAQHSQTTDFFSAFDYFKTHFDEPSSSRDLFVFFVSDGLVDLLPHERIQKSVRERNLEEGHNARLFQMLEAHGARWRLYNICLGDSVNLEYHKNMLHRTKIDRRRDRGLYPGFKGSEPGNPFLLRVDDAEVSKRWLKIESAIASVLLTHGASQVVPDSINGSVAKVPGLGSVALRLRVKVKPAIAANVFQQKMRVSFVISNARYNIRLKLDHNGAISNGLAAFDFVVDSLDVMTQLNTIGKTPNDIGSWEIAVHGLSPGQTVERLEVLYEHGWVVQIDKLEIAPDPPGGRSFLRAVLDKPEPCEPVLRFHARVQNICGEKLGDSTAVLEIIGDKTYPLKVRQTQHTDDTVGDEYEWSAEIRDSEYLLSKLGETVMVSAFVAGRRFIFETSSVPVKVCAKY